MKPKFVFPTFLLLLFTLSVMAGDKPNIVFFISDDMSKIDAGPYRTSEIQTPTMNQLAKEGMLFHNAFIASPACAPSRAALLTGLMPSRNGAEANHTYPWEGIPYLVKNLQDAGYEVLAFGKVAHGRGVEDCGFDYFNRVGKRKALTKAFKNYMSERTSTKPVCAFLGDHRPHVKWIEKSTYDPEKAELPEYFIDTKETREHWARYSTDITGLDNELGKALTYTKQAFGNNYVFMFSSDHGSQWPFAKWNLYDAGTNVPLIVSWPGVIEATSETQAMVSWVDILPTFIDISGSNYADSLDGKSFLPVLKGESNVHREVIFTTHSGDGHMNAYPIRSVRTDSFKYILNLYPEYQHFNHSDILRKDGAGAYWDSWDSLAKIDDRAAGIVHKYHIRPAEELYNIIDDPTEQINLASYEKHAETLADLRELLENWMVKQKDSRKVFSTPVRFDEPLPTKEQYQKK